MLGGQARVVIMPMGVGIMTDLRGNVDVLAKTGAFPPSKKARSCGSFFALKNGVRVKCQSELVFCYPNAPACLFWHFILTLFLGTHIISDDITT